MKHKTSRCWQLILLVLFMLIVFAATTTCADTQDPEDTPLPPDYSLSRCWAYQSLDPAAPVDVFFVYPTIYAEKSPGNMDLADQRLRDIAGKYIRKAYAGAYSSQANLFMPYYRQVSMARLDPTTDMFQNPCFLIGYRDISQAFDYYMNHLNNGRPFILAGHSQGAMQLVKLMRDRFNDTVLQRKLVAAYLIGYSVTKEEYQRYPWLKAAQGGKRYRGDHFIQHPGSRNDRISGTGQGGCRHQSPELEDRPDPGSPKAVPGRGVLQQNNI